MPAGLLRPSHRRQRRPDGGSTAVTVSPGRRPAEQAHLVSGLRPAAVACRRLTTFAGPFRAVTPAAGRFPVSCCGKRGHAVRSMLPCRHTAWINALGLIAAPDFRPHLRYADENLRPRHWTETLLRLPLAFAMGTTGPAMHWLRWLVPMLVAAAFGIMPVAASEIMRTGGHQMSSMFSATQKTAPAQPESEIVAKNATCSAFSGCNVLIAMPGWDWCPVLHRSPYPLHSIVASPGYELMPPVPPPRMVG